MTSRDPGPVVAVPTSQLMLAIMGLARQRPADEPATSVDSRGVLWLQYAGVGTLADQSSWRVAIPADDPHAAEAARAIQRGAERPHAGIQLAALLTALTQYSGEPRAWCLERAVELAYGRRCARSNRAREIVGFRGWLRLLQIADIYVEWIDDGEKRSWVGNVFSTWTQHSRKSATFTLDTTFLSALGKYTAKVPAVALFDLHRPDGWTNPHGYGPSVAALARIRLAAFFKAKRHQLGGADTHHARAGRLRQLVELAGLDITRIEVRRSARRWWLRVQTMLRRLHVTIGLGGPMPSRVPGIPRPHGPGAVFPILDPHGRAIYLQIRNGITESGPRSRAGSKYLNPRTDEFGRCPRACWPKTTRATRDEMADAVLICEGMPDTLIATQAGFTAVGLLGTGHSANTEGAAAIVRRHPTEKLVLALDNDDAAARALPKLAAALHDAGARQRIWRLHLPAGVNDLNDWHLQVPDFADHLAAAVRAASPFGWGIPPVAARFPGWCATLADRAGVLAIQTSFPTLDDHLAHGGWRPGIHLFGGCPGVGKSAFATQCALHAARTDHPVLYVSIEQPPEDLIGRIFCKELGVSIDRYWNRDPSYLALARGLAPGLPLHNLHIVTDPALVQDTTGTAGRIRAWTETLEHQTGTRPLVIIDYLQEMRPPDRDRSKDERIQIARSGLTLRQLARDMGVPVIVISSINRVSYQTTPNLAAFKGSGDLEYQADTALLLRVRAASDDEAAAMTEKDWHAIPLELHLVKNRYGRITGQHPILINFDRQHGGFREEQSGGNRTPSSAVWQQPESVPEHLRF